MNMKPRTVDISLTQDDLKFVECIPITNKTWIQFRNAIREMIIAQAGIPYAILRQQKGSDK